MSRVEWAALSGEDVEAVVSNLLYNEHPRAIRIRPSQGDFGIDVLVPSQARPGAWDVYQIKKFATTLDESHKRQIDSRSAAYWSPSLAAVCRSRTGTW